MRYSCRTDSCGSRSGVVLRFSVLLFSFRSHRDQIGREIARSSSTFWALEWVKRSYPGEIAISGL